MTRFAGKSVRLSPDVLFQDVEGEAVLLDLSGGEYFGLNEVGTRFWSVATETGRLDDILERILEDFDVDAATLESDLAGFLDEMAGAGLITIVDDDAGS